MSHQKQYTISLEVKGPDGYLRSFDFLMAEPTGSCSIEKLDLLSMQLGRNLQASLDMKHLVEVVSSRRVLQSEQGLL